MADVKPLFKTTGSSSFLPVAVFVVNAWDNAACYAWLAEPSVTAKGATLHFHETGEFHALDPSAVNTIIERAMTWYEALPRQLMPA